MLWFKCKHPAEMLVVDKKETREKKSEDFDIVRYHMNCLNCGAKVEVKYAEMRGGVSGFMERGRAETPNA